MNNQMTAILLGIILLVGMTTRAEVWSTNLPVFHGGAYDGWDCDVTTNAVAVGNLSVSLSSGTEQTFAWTQAGPAGLAALTIDAQQPGGMITNGGTIRVTVPESWQCRFDMGVTVTIGGDASGKVGAASFSGDGRALEIPVTSDFAAADTFTVSGLKLQNLVLCRAGTQRLELDFDGDGVLDVYDEYALVVTVSSPGGSYDGYDCDAMIDAVSLMLSMRTLFIMR